MQVLPLLSSSLGPLQSLFINQLNLPVQQKTPDIPLPTAPCSEGVCAPRLEGGRALPPAAPQPRTPGTATTPEKGHSPPFQHGAVQTNSTEGGKENAQRTKGRSQD